MTHELKIKEAFADAVVAGEKTFEIRVNDRGFQRGDLVKFTAIDDLKLKIHHPINGRTYEITYVLSGWGLNGDTVAFSIREVGDTSSDEQARHLPLEGKADPSKDPACGGASDMTATRTACAHEWECVSVNTGGWSYRCRRCGEFKTIPYADKSDLILTNSYRTDMRPDPEHAGDV